MVVGDERSTHWPLACEMCKFWFFSLHFFHIYSSRYVSIYTPIIPYYTSFWEAVVIKFYSGVYWGRNRLKLNNPSKMKLQLLPKVVLLPIGIKCHKQVFQIQLWFPVYFRLQFKLLCLTYKTLYNLLPKYFRPYVF